MRTVIYARKSTDRDDKQAHSLEDQIKSMMEVARREGLIVLETIQESASAKNPNARPEFARMIQMFRDGQADAILTWAANRLSRNEVDGGWVSYLLHSGVIKLIRTPDRVYRPEDSSLLFAIDNAVSSDYTRNLRRDVNRGLKEKAERGWHPCKAPIGYLNDAETREIVPDPARFDLVRKAWETMLDGTRTVSAAHREAVARGLTVSNKRGTPRPVSLARFYSMFREPFYAGKVDFNGKLYQGKHRPVVTEDEFDRVQSTLNDRFRMKEPKERGMAFAGCLRCAKCGAAIVGERRVKRYTRRPRTTTYSYYHCSGKRGCSKRAVREEDLIGQANAALAQCALPRETAQWIQTAFAGAVERGAVETASDLTTLGRELTRQRARLNRLAEMRLDGDFTPEEHATLRENILTEIVQIEQRIERSRGAGDRLLRTIDERLKAAVRAGELRGTSRDPLAMARALRVLGTGVLNLSTLEIRMDPIIAKIAGFEPLGDGSERPKPGDGLLSNSVWWNLVEELLKVATEEVCCAYERDVAWNRRYGRYSWKLPDKDPSES